MAATGANTTILSAPRFYVQPVGSGKPGWNFSEMANITTEVEVALPLVLVTQLHASPVWTSAVFVINTGLVVAFQLPVTVWVSRFARRSALAISGVVISSRTWASSAASNSRTGGPSRPSSASPCSSRALAAATAPEHAVARPSASDREDSLN